jgi:hypothetical protein
MRPGPDTCEPQQTSDRQGLPASGKLPMDADIPNQGSIRWFYEALFMHTLS